MMQFIFTPPRATRVGCLKYINEEFSFNTVNSDELYSSSLLINDINIVLNKDGLAVSIFGLAPFMRWIDGSIVVPQSIFMDLRVSSPIIPGVSYRINDIPWKVTWDKKNGWIEIKDDRSLCEEYVNILDDVIVGIRDSNIVGLWLHPEFVA